MKEFLVYTALRLGLFAACLAVVLGVWWAASGSDRVSESEVLVSMIVAFLVSGIASYFLLDRFRQPLARKVEQRAARASERLDEMRAREDRDQ